MKNLNSYFWQIYLPIQIISIITIALVYFDNLYINWWVVFISWFLIGPIGVGVGYHRLFSHRQFKSHKFVEYILALLGTLSTYGPVLYWVSEHQHHHKHADTDLDINNPKHGLLHSLIYWRLTSNALKSVLIKDRCSIAAFNDKNLRFMNDNYAIIVYGYLIISLLFGLSTFVSIAIIPILIERFRLNILNSVSHIKMIGSYKNFNNGDNSYNNLFIGYLTFGFGWHNNHHAYPRKLILTEKWWELDIEGYIGWLCSKIVPTNYD